jgi:hypothetical protein
MAESKPFRAWVNQKAAELSTGKTVDELVTEAMEPKNLKVEVRTSEGWEIIPAEAE